MNLTIATALPAPPPAQTAQTGNAPDVADAADFSNHLGEARAATPPAPAAKARLPAKAPPGAADTAATPVQAKPAPDAASATGEATLRAPEAGAPAEDAPPADLSALLPGWAVPTAAAPEPKSAAGALAADAPRGAKVQRVLEAVARDVPLAAFEAPGAEAVPPHAEPRAPRAAPEPALAMRAPEAAAVAAAPLFASVPAQAPDAAPSTPCAALAPSLQHPGFAPALAAQVRWWADAGVQQAQLTLNPAEMGPVTVRIVVTDAREARIDFAADLAATRQAIEGSLPVLAAALDESGLKLAGGGVHDGQAQRQHAWLQARAGQAHRTAGDDRGVPAVMPAPGGAGRGLVDLLA